MSNSPAYMVSPGRNITFPKRIRAEKWEPKKINGRHEEMIRMAAGGMKYNVIAQVLHITPQSVSIVMRSDIVQERIAEIRLKLDDSFVDARTEIKEAAGEAAQLLVKVMNGEGEFEGVNANLRAKTAESLLDRGGFGKVQRVEANIQHGYAGEVGIKLILENATKAVESRARLVNEERSPTDAPREDPRQQSEAEV